MSRSGIPGAARSLAQLGLDATCDPTVRVSGLASASGQVLPGDLFAALPGTLTHGARYSAQAEARGAAAILTDVEGSEIGQALVSDSRCQIIIDKDPRLRLANIAARLFAPPPPLMVGVTGTNGKTTVTAMCRQLWQGIGRKAANYGTNGIDGDFAAPPGLSTPDPITLHRTLHAMVAAGVECVALEATSHGLVQSRLGGIEFDAGAFTNLTHEHFDYHDGPADYFEAKSLLFRKHIRQAGAAIVCTDSAHGERMARIASRCGLRTTTVGRKSADVQMYQQRVAGQFQEVHFNWRGLKHRATLQLVGTYQAVNVLTAAALVVETGGELDQVIGLLPQLITPKGRMDLVARRDNGALIFVDYAHTPAALKSALGGLRPHVSGRILVICGAGGNRDRSKRKLMGRMAASYADLAIVTDDNPRFEEPADIRHQILQGCPDALEIGDRAEAIFKGIGELGPGDALVIAGKGHENSQIVGDSVLPFNDSETASMAARLVDGKQT